MKEEIVGGIRNALSHGESIEKAVQTFINAGYSPHEVREAASVVSPSAANVLQPPTSAQNPSPISPETAAAQSSSQSPPPPISSKAGTPTDVVGGPKQATPLLQTRPQQPPIAEQGHGKKFVIILLTIFILLLGALIFTIMYSDNLVGTLFGK